jgi:hypothetical protein
MKNDVCILEILDNYSPAAVESAAFALEITHQKSNLNRSRVFNRFCIFPRIVRSWT